MSRTDLEKTLLPNRAIERPGEPSSRRHVVNGIAWLQTIQEPKPSLGIRKRRAHLVAQMDQSRSVLRAQPRQ